MIKTGKTKEEKSFLSKSLVMPILYNKKERKKKKKKRKKTEQLCKRKNSFSFFFFTLVSDVFENKNCKEIEYMEVC